MKWIKGGNETKVPVKSWCEEIEPQALQQAYNLANHPAIAHHVALMPDCHVGYGMPIGGVIAAKDALIPNAVGVDIGCGMVAVETDLPVERFADMAERRALMIKIKERIPVGEGHGHGSEQTWGGFDTFCDEHGEAASLWPNNRDRYNLGSLGGGNHFIELQVSEAGFIWLMIHSGSRNLGQRVATHYHAEAKRVNEQYRVKLPDPDLAFLPSDSKAGQEYLRDMTFALAYALENRRRMMSVCKEALAEMAGACAFVREVNIHHNYAALESHFGHTFYVHRKGATRARLGETGIIPGSMGTPSYIVRGLGNPESFMSCSHGAGRAMSRTEASRQLTEDACNQAMKGIAFDRWGKYKSKWGKKSPGAHATADLSEAPQAYKDIDAVIDAERDLVEPVVKLRPLAVVKGRDHALTDDMHHGILMAYDLVRLGQEVEMTVNSISEAKAHFSALIEEVSKGNDVIIGRAGKPIAVLTPFTRQLQPRTPGSLRGKIRIGADFDALPDDIASAFGVPPS